LLIPTVDMFRCIGGDEPTSQKQVVLAAEETAPAEKAPIHGDGDVLCVHGHCHHWMGDTQISDRPVFRVALSFSETAFGAPPSPPSALKLELLRPPRA
jgi:hypothetical protein